MYAARRPREDGQRSHRQDHAVNYRIDTYHVAVGRSRNLSDIVIAAGAIVGGGSAAVAAPPPLTGSFVQVVAHQDDDLLFMNPDLQNTINARRPITTVYLTAGENTNDPEPAAPPLAQCRQQGFGFHDSREHYAFCRQEGERRAWASMAGVANAWTRQAVTLSSPGRVATPVEIDTLDGAPSPVALVFLNLPERADAHEDTRPPGDPFPPGDALRLMYDNGGVVRRTIVPTSSAVTAGVDYNRARLIDALIALYERFQPTVVRVQDTQPDTRYRPDHDDHVYGARFAVEALRQGFSQRVQVVTVWDYNISQTQVNLDSAQISAKQAVFNTYRAMDEHVEDVGGNGDYDTGFPSRENHRWWGGTTWVGRNADGRLQVFELRLDTYETVTMYQTQVNGSWANNWVGLGNPNTDLGNENQVGLPVATTNADGRIQVFQKNGGGGVSTVYQTAPNGGFSGWVDKFGTGVQDGLAVTTNPNGRIELFAYAIVNGIGRITQWYQPVPNGDLVINNAFPALEPSGPPTVATNKDGRLDLFYRLASNANGAVGSQVGHTWQIQVGGGWTSSAQNIGGHGGIGPVAAANAPADRDGSTSISDARIMLFQRNRGGGISMVRQVAPDAGYETSWTDTGGFIASEPAVAADRFGWMFAFAISADGRLMVRHQTGPSGSAPFTDWALV